MALPDFTWETGRLLGYIGSQPVDGQVLITEIMLSLESLGLAFQRLDLQKIESICNALLTRYQEPSEGRAILTEIRDKARNWREYEALERLDKALENAPYKA